MTISVKNSMIASFSMMIILIVSLSATTLGQSLKSARLTEDIHSNLLSETRKLMKLEKNILQIQQWFTDISVTGETSPEAENNYNQAVGILEEMIK